MRISEMRNLYISDVSETSDDNYQERLDSIVRSLRERYPDTNVFTDEILQNMAVSIIRRNQAIHYEYDLYASSLLEHNPELAEWVKFTYEEILQMESTGVLIPEEVLAWAHAMQDSDTSTYVVNDDSLVDEESDSVTENSNQSEFAEMQKKALTLSNKSESTELQINQTFEEFEEIAKRAEQIKNEQETSKKDSLEKIEDLTKEWDEISQKVKRGDKLTDAEQARYKELASMLNGKDGELMTELQASFDDLENLIISMDGLSDDIKSSVELGNQTVDIAKQLSGYEAGYQPETVTSSSIPDVTTGDIRNILAGAEGQSIAEDALDNGNSLIEFSGYLNDQLMMNQYASLYDFAKTFTQTSSETINNTKEVLGDDFNKTTEELNEQIDALPDMTNAEKDEASLNDMGIGLLGQTLYFATKSIMETSNSSEAMFMLSNIQMLAKREQKNSQLMTDTIVNQMTSKSEEADSLTEKKERAEENNEVMEQKIDDISNPTSEEEAKELEQIYNESEANPEEEFTEEDERNLNNLNDELKESGDLGQQKLSQSYATISGLRDNITENDLSGNNAIEYGEMSIQKSEYLSKTLLLYGPLFFFAYSVSILGYVAGLVAQETGEENNEIFDTTSSNLDISEASIVQNQLSIENVTNVSAIGNTSTGMETTSENADETTNTDDTETGTDETNEETSAINVNESDVVVSGNFRSMNAGEVVLPSNNSETSNEVGIETGAAANVSNAGQNSNSNSSGAASDNSVNEDMSADQAASEGDLQQENAKDSQSQVNDAIKDADSAQKESQGVKKDSEKTEAELAREMKNIENNNEKDTENIEKTANDSKDAQEEQIQLAEEFEALDAENQSIIASQSQNNNSPVQNNNFNGGGLLAPLTSGQSNAGNMEIQQATLVSNNARIQTIASRFQVLTARIMKNRLQITKTIGTINQRTNKFEKLAKQKLKIQQTLQKKEAEKQKQIQVASSVIDICSSVFSIVTAVGTIIGVVGKTLISTGSAMVIAGGVSIAAGTVMCSNPFTFIPGVALIAAGTALKVSGGIMTATGGVLEGVGEALTIAGVSGIGACGVAKGSILAATGDIQGALTTLLSTIASIAMSFIPGAGAAASTATSVAQTALQITSSALNIASSSANIASSALTLQGKDNTDANMVSSIFGAASALVGVGSGFAGSGANSGFSSGASAAQKAGAAFQVISAVGSTASTTAQISTIIKQANGENPGELENILNIIGFSLSTAAALGQMGIQISDTVQKNKDNTENVSVDSDAESANSDKSAKNIKASDKKVNNMSPQEKASMAFNIINGVGQTVTSIAQISAQIKQMQGKETGKFENIMGIIGGSLSGVASVGMLGTQIAQVSEANKIEKAAKTDNSSDEQNKDDKNKKESDLADVEQNKETQDESTKKKIDSDIPVENIVNMNADNTLGISSDVAEISDTLEDIGDLELPEIELPSLSVNISDTGEDIVGSIDDIRLNSAKKVASEVDVNVGVPKKVAGKTFEITEDGYYMVDNKKVTPGEFKDTFDEAKKTRTGQILQTIADSANMTKQVYEQTQNLEETDTELSASETREIDIATLRRGRDLINKIEKRKKALLKYARYA